MMQYPYSYPGNFQPYYPAPVPDPLQLRQAAQQTGPTDDRIWVQGETAATAYLVAANGFVRLWDSTQPVFYEKQSDASGRPMPMVIYDYKRRGGEPELVTTYDYTEQIAALSRRIEALEKKEAEADV